MRKLLLFIFLLGIFTHLHAKELKVVDFQESPLDISARENPIVDANGDACAIIKARTGVENVKFYADLGIKKVERHDGEYWLWVSAGTKRITIESEELGVAVYELPEFTSEYMVYVIFLDAVLPDKIVYNEVAFLTFKTKPKKAKVFIDNNFFGKTPFTVTYPDNKFEYRVEKRKYLVVASVDSLVEESKTYNIDLELDTSKSRLFFGPSIGIDKTGIIDYGIMIGTLKNKKGMFVSLNLLMQDLIFRDYSDYLKYPHLNDTSIIHTKETKNRIRINYNYLRLLTRKMYIDLGLGISSNDYFNKVEVIDVFDDNKKEFKILTDNSYLGVNLNIGLLYNIKDKFIISLRAINNFQLFSTQLEEAEFNFKYVSTELNFGLCYIF